MNNEMKSPRLWDKANPLVSQLEPKVGPLHDERDRLKATLAKSMRCNLVSKRQDEIGLFTDAIETDQQRDSRDYYSIVSRTRAEAHVRKDEPDALYLALETTSSDGVLNERYLIDSNGVLIDMNDMAPVAEDSDEFVRARKAAKGIDSHLQSSIATYERRRRERISTITKRSLGGIAAILAVGGGVLGARVWIYEPQEAAQEYRNEYDRIEHTLPGEGAPVDGHPFEIVSQEQFEAIPSYGGDDKDLDQPRQITLASDSYGERCKTIDTVVPETGTLHVAVPQGSQLTELHYQTSIKADRKGFTICVIEPDETEEQKNPIALQFK